MNCKSLKKFKITQKKRIDKEDTKRGINQTNLESIFNNSEKLKNNKLNIKNWHNIKWNSF